MQKTKKSSQNIVGNLENDIRITIENTRGNEKMNDKKNGSPEEKENCHSNIQQKSRYIMIDPIITNENLPVNEDEATIQRCPHDEENPYAQISRDLIRDASISPSCRWLVIYLLSMKNGWKINIKQIVNHLKGQIGRDQVYQLVNEAIEAGYMKRETVSKGNLKQQTKYFISEKAKFKKSFRHPESQDTESRDTENQDYKKEHPSKEKHREDSSLKVPEEPKAAKAAEVEKKKSPKPKKEKEDFSEKVRDVAKKLLNSLTRTKPDYKPPKNMSAFLTEVDLLLRRDERDPTTAVDVFNWALADSFWADKMFKPNPAKYLREKFDQLEMKMNSKPKANPNEVDRRLRDEDGNVVDEWKDRMF
jgi:hypothetical protein